MAKILFSQRPEDYKILLVKEMKSIESFFKKEFDLDIYLIYGTLLGAIREKDFIGHDYDVDLAYFSKANSEEKSILEFKNICDILQKNKLLLKIKGNRQLHCKSLNNNMKFDIWRSYKLTESKLYLSPIGFLIHPNYILPLNKLIFKKINFNIPNMSEKLIDLLYKDWTKPVLNNFRKFEY